MIINYRLEKISIQKTNKPTGPVEAKNNLKIVNIKEESMASLTKEKALAFKFEFNINYEPKIALIEIIGDVIFMQNTKTIKEILDHWKKTKKIDPKIATPIFNFILEKCNIKALGLEEDVELPFHIPIPRLKTKSDITQQTPPKAA